MDTHEMQCSSRRQEKNGDTHEQQIDRSLFETAMTVWSNPRIRATLDLFNSGDIHKYAGGSLRAYDKSGRIFWNDHGTFVAENGAIYQLRSDDEGVPQVYTAPVDGRGNGLYCVQPYTYDVYSNPDLLEMRFDFINDVHHAPPINSPCEIDTQRRAGLDVMAPSHKEGVIFDARRDSISMARSTDGVVNVMLHDSGTGITERLHDSMDIELLLQLLDTVK